MQNLDGGAPAAVTPEYITSGHYEVDIAGIRYGARVSLRSPTLTNRFRAAHDDHYVATRHGGGQF